MSTSCSYETTGFAPQLLQLLNLTQALWATQLMCSLSPPEMWPDDYGESASSNALIKYDFIVVGAGTAGSAVASRLSENPNWNVLLIEAGANPPVESEVPAMLLSLQKTKYDWQYYTDTDVVDKSYCKAQKNKGCFWPRGKMLGGSSSLNYMMYVRGNKADFDGWAKLGNSGWDYDSVLPYFKKSENNHYDPFVNYKNGKYHSVNGPQDIDFFSEDGTESIQQMVLNAAIETGNKHIDDINADKSLGYVKIQGFYYNGTRQSSAKAFLNPVKNRPNLHIIKNAFVQRIIIRNKKACGVRFLYNGTTVLRAFSEKEVIISTGSIMSPQLLMLSGIGPRKQLRKFGIPLRQHNVGVGRNLQDHPFVTIWTKFNPTATPANATLNSLYQYATYKNGPFASIGVTQMTGFINSVNGTGVPDFQMGMFYFTANSTSNLQILLNILNYTDDISNALLNEIQNHDIAAFLPTQLHEKSRGSIELASCSAADHPIIRPNYFDEKDDMDAHLRMIKQHISNLKTSSYASKGAEFIDLPVPECDQYKNGSNNYYRCYIRYFSGTSYHPVGTCKMGPASDPTAVVNHRLKVHNVDNLRVIDASIMPTIVSGNINAATLMIGEKGADMIKKHYS